MKKNKVLAVMLTAGMITSLAACGGSKENTAPVISGVNDSMVEAGKEFNAMSGVTAMDAEDGDLTSKITIESMPSLSFKNGKVTPDKAGSYELTYTVTDSEGLTHEAFATLTVAKETADAVLYRDFDFKADQKVDTKGWNAYVADGNTSKAELKEGSYVFTVTNPGNGDGDIKLSLGGLKVKPADYRIKVWAKSTKKTFTHIIARDETADGWATFGGTYNAVISEEVSPLELYFSVPKDATSEIMINLGKITPNPENPSDTTPSDFVVTIDKIELYEITGAESEVIRYSNNFEAGNEGVIVSAGDGADGNAKVEGNAAVVTINNYPTSGGVWSIKADLSLGNEKIENGKKYYYSFKLKADNAQAGECLVESSSKYDSERVHFNGFAAGANEETVISGVFTADKGISDPVIRLQIGNPSEGVTANKITIDDVVFGVVEGDKEVNKTIYAFSAFGRGTANENNTSYPWMTFNGTDEDNEKGVGTIWTNNGSMFYRIDNAGVVDWHNKLICGFGENPLVLEADSYYTVEITAKATKPVSCAFFLNPLGSWDPRVSEGIDFTTEEKTYTFETKDTFVTDMNFEMLFQFGSEKTAEAGEVTVEITGIKLYQRKVK